MTLEKDEVLEFQAWLKEELPTSAKKRAAIAVAAVTLQHVERGSDDIELTADTIADMAKHDSYGDPDKARKWLNRLALPEFLQVWESRQIDWLSLRRPDATHFLTIATRASGGGRGNQRTYALVRKNVVDVAGNEAPPSFRPGSDPGADSTTVTDSSAPQQVSEQPATESARISYDMVFCGPGELTWQGRLVFGNGPFRRGSLRWRFLAGGFIAYVVIAFLMFMFGVVLPISGITRMPVGTSLVAIFSIAVLYWSGIRPWIRVVDDRIRMADENLLKGIKPIRLHTTQSAPTSRAYRKPMPKSATRCKPSQRVFTPGSPSLFRPRKPPSVAISRIT